MHDPRQYERAPSTVLTLPIDPTQINADGSYLVACPAGTKFLSVGVFDDTKMVVWVAVPSLPDSDEEHGDAPTSCTRLWLLAGGQRSAPGMVADCDYIGIGMIVDRLHQTIQDWHVFAERSPAFAEGELLRVNATLH